MSRLGDLFRRGPRGERPPGSRPEAGPPAPTGPRFSLWALVAALGVAFALQYFTSLRGSPSRQAYSELRRALAEDRVEEVLISSNLVRWRLKPDGKTTEQARTFEAVRIEDEDLVRELDRHRVKTSGVVESSLFRDLLAWVLPLGLVVAVMIFLGRRAGQGPGGFLAVGQSKAKIYVEKEVGVTFADVAGVDEAKEELQEVIEFLKTPEKFRRLGGKIPKGVLLVGPPGTGKTLLARAVAGEASVPFFSISGSEFVELFVGVGAARVRDLFNQAKEKAPCIIFIDELDALGKARGMGPMAHEEREQTLNQLLVELDGFDARAGVILMAATNRPEILDPALLRAGRFDRHVLVDRPDRIGRLAILKVHARNILLADPADLEVIAGMTAGLVGADLANLVNEAALLGVRRGKESVGRGELVEAVERVIGGLEKKNRVLNPAEKQRVAYHEIGHALAAFALSGDAVQKISIIPRGIAALGYTLQLPTEDRFLMTEGELRNKIAVLLGGRAAEELIYGEVSTGAQDDLSRATEIARSMVKSYGMSHKLGHLSFDRGHRPLFLEAQGPERGDYSEETAREIDCEVRRLVDGQYARVREVLMPQRRILEAAAVELLKRETLSGDELKGIVAQHPAEPAPSPLRSVC